jgi:flavin reductase (DIM6/NTAB) family NADH-FMN oxidoreductase RutF
MPDYSLGGICCSTLPHINISLRKATYSYAGIMENKAFTVSIPSEDFVKKLITSASQTGQMRINSSQPF